jgi:hypothetical protein
VKGGTDADFERGFVAMGYALGQRGDALLEPLGEPSLSARALGQALAHPERGARAQVLAAELARLVHALGERRIR